MDGLGERRQLLLSSQSRCRELAAMSTATQSMQLSIHSPFPLRARAISAGFIGGYPAVTLNQRDRSRCVAAGRWGEPPRPCERLARAVDDGSSFSASVVSMRAAPTADGDKDAALDRARLHDRAGLLVRSE